MNRYSSKYNYLLLSIIILALMTSSCNITRHVPNDQYLLNSVTLNCDNPNISSKDLKTTIKQQPNRKILYIYRFHLRFYNLMIGKKENSVKERIANVIGEPPVIYDEYATEKSAELMKSYLQSQAYYDAEVKVDKHIKKKKVELIYNVKTGKPLVITELNYDIFDNNIYKLIIQDSLNSLLKLNTNLNTDILQQERERIVKYLKTNGYYYFSLNNIHYLADTLENKYEAKLTLSIQKDFSKDINSYEDVFTTQTIRNVYLYSNYNSQLAVTNPEDYAKSLDTLFIDGINIIYSNKLEISPSVLLQSCFIKKGDIYNAQDIEKTHAHISSLKQFKYINIKLNPADDEILPGHKEKYIDVNIYLTPYLKRSYTTELEGNNTSGNIGMSGVLTLTNRNLFKAAHILSAKTSLSFQTIATSTEETQEKLFFFNTLEYGGELKYDIPQLLIPFYKNYDFVRNHNPKTQLRISYNYQQRPDYTRSIGNASFGYYFKSGKNNFLTHYLNLIEFNLVKIYNFDPDFQKQIQNLYIKYSYEDQLLSVISYDLLFNNQSHTKTRSSSYLWINLETSGNLPSLIYKLANIEKTDNSYRFMGIEFAQFVKADIDYRYYQVFNKNQSLVYRGFFGIGIPYGNSTKGLPFIKKYYIGGANDIRAWRVRSVGPGSYANPNTSYDQIADMKIMFNLEYRFKIISIVNGAFFVDAGNIWALDKKDNRAGALFTLKNFYREVALGTGFGIRFDLSLVIARFDFGIPLYNPALPENYKWFNVFKNLKWRDLTFHFGINYPF